MDFERSVEALIPGVRGDILGVLSRTTAELKLRTIADLAGVSPAQASRVLRRLVALGVVERRDVAPSALFRLVRDHVAGSLVAELAELDRRAHRHLARLATRLVRRGAVNVTLFGSLAHGQAGPDSDVDVLVVLGRDVSETDEHWAAALDTFVRDAGRYTGNRVNPLIVDEDGCRRLLRSRRPPWSDIRADGITLAGTLLTDLARIGA